MPTSTAILTHPKDINRVRLRQIDVTWKSIVAPLLILVGGSIALNFSLYMIGHCADVIIDLLIGCTGFWFSPVIGLVAAAMAATLRNELDSATTSNAAQKPIQLTQFCFLIFKLLFLSGRLHD